ncbi:MAG: hypothetical protein V4654_09135 [Bdellovibrionota bacterium]
MKQLLIAIFVISTSLIGGDACNERLPAGSSFKVPLAVIAFDSGILKDSIVWFSKRITTRLGQKKLWTGDLLVSKKSITLTREINYLETSPNGFKISGKTGSDFYDKDQKFHFGWFILKAAELW